MAATIDTTAATMKMSSIKVSRSGETVLIPPKLPSYLADTYTLKPIVGTPTDEQVKAIHAVIRSHKVMAHLPKFSNFDLSMQLSQHLFGAQMAVYKAEYLISLLPGDKSVYTPPELPSHIPITLDKVVGTPSDESIKSAQNALRSLDSLANHSQLFDEDLSMKLSQHVFNLQFARYMHDSSTGHFASEIEPEEECPEAPQSDQETHEPLTPHESPNLQNAGRPPPSISETEPVPGTPLTLAQLGEIIVKAIKDTSSESKDVLQNMNRILTSMKNDQSTAGCMPGQYHIFKNPLNRRGVLASEHGLPHLCYWYNHNTVKFALWHSDDSIARYLKFFEIGTDLIRGGNRPKLIDGKRDEAEKLLLAQVGLDYY